MEKHDKNEFALDIESVLSSNYKWHGNIEVFFKLVKATGYPYFSWNGVIYKVNDYQYGYEQLDLTIDDVRKLRLKEEIIDNCSNCENGYSFSGDNVTWNCNLNYKDSFGCYNNNFSSHVRIK